VKDPQTLAAVAGAPVPSASNGAAPTPPSAAPATVPRVPGAPELTKDGLYVFSASRIELVVDPNRDGNAVRFALDDRNVLAAPAAGTTRYSAEIEVGALLLKSPDGITQKRYRLDAARRWVEASYTLTNTTTETIHVQAAEQHAVSFAGGVTFFPNAPTAPFAWFLHQPPRVAPPLRGSLSVGHSWVASAGEGMLFIEDHRGISATELSVASAYDSKTKERPWLEIGARSPDFELTPGTSATWNTLWFLRHLPPSITVKPGNQALVDFVLGVLD